MKRLGVLVIGRSYFVPYVEWLAAMDGELFTVSGYIDNEDSIYAASVPGYSDKRNIHSLEELADDSDLMLSLGYWRIVPKNIIDKVPLGILNLHHSYMLRYRGRHTATWAIMNKEKTHGTTLHYMSECLDDGPILAAREVAIQETDTAYALFNRINVAALDMVKENVPVALDVDRIRQVELMKPDPCFRMYRKRDLCHELTLGELRDSPAAFSRRVRALTFPGMPKPYVVVDGTKIYMTAENEP